MNSFLEVSIPMDYKNTIITPKTDFPMKAGLPTREPGMLSRWEEQNLYEAMLEKNKDLPPFVLHDGPPFSNGDIHMGHALNKTLKDFIVRSHAMMGYYTPYVPGWDNHGLPIETAIIKKSKLTHTAMPVPQFRAACEEFAETYIQRQMAGFKRLGVVGNWKHPYRTMDKHFEAQEVKVFGRMFDKGYIYKGLKPVYWCPVCATAVAEAEIEYHDDPCTSVYVKFPMHDDLGRLSHLDHSKLYFVIWTTTVWTLPGNLAIALRNMGCRVGGLDADIYGPSQPRMFGVEGYVPEAVAEDGVDHIVPAESMDVKLMSIGFFIKPTDALLWRGAMAVSALKQMIHQTRWAKLAFLLTDLPPGTGDVHLTIIGEQKIDAAVIVSTPQQIAVADVVRGVEMFRNENVNIPVAGIVENMAWFTPAELPENRYYIFGRGGARAYAEKNGVEFLGEIPIIQSIMDGADAGTPAAGIDSRVEEHYRGIAEKIVGKVMKNG